MSRAYKTIAGNALATAMICLGGASAYAQDAPAPSGAGIDVSGYVDTYYGYNFNKVAPSLRAYDVQHNAFSLSQTELVLSKPVSMESRLGFRTDFAFGKAADLTAIFEPNSEGDVYKNIQQAYLSVLANEKLQIDVGRYNTPIGAEVIEAQDNWNYSRSILFGFAIPFNHTGVRATLTASNKFILGAYLTNGWNSGVVMPDGKPCFGLSATAKPNDKLTWIGNFMVGTEVAGGDTRSIFDTTLTLAASPKFSLQGNFDYGKEGDVTWWGAAAYAKVAPSAKWALAGRYEYIDDTDGGFMTIGDKAQSITVTSDHKILDSLNLKIDLRLDSTDGDFFVDEDGSPKDSQTAVIVGLIYSFSGGKI